MSNRETIANLEYRRAYAELVDCPRCAADPGRRCVDRESRVPDARIMYHSARYDRAVEFYPRFEVFLDPAGWWRLVTRQDRDGIVAMTFESKHRPFFFDKHTYTMATESTSADENLATEGLLSELEQQRLTTQGLLDDIVAAIDKLRGTE